jgi:DNA (cytosine-5)-methyltransferase 1
MTETCNAWDKSKAVEESAYYWTDTPLYMPAITENNDTDRSKIVELFCGCGGTSLGFEQAGFNVQLGADIHAPSIETFRNNHPDSASILGDVSKISENQLYDYLITPPEVLIAGVPCQGFSLNNRKRHNDDKRNFLYREFVRIAERTKPRVVVLENVSGMRSSGDIVESIKRDLQRATGLQITSRLLNAADYGVPQTRQRLIFVGIRDEVFDFDTVAKTHGPGTGKPYNTVHDAISDLPELMNNEEKNSYDAPAQTSYQKEMRKGVRKNQLTNHKAPNHPAETIKKIAQTKPGQPMYPAFKQRIRLSWEHPSPTQVSGGIRPQFQFGHPSQARGLSVRERCRIQSFPDNFIVSGGIVQGRVQTGNAVPPKMAHALALAIKKYIK